ncbi:MAG TPA: AbrB/MazE/SpoVT family DNA-binding domain-containing protein, partial [Mycobacterium sp.]|nr:AbrB/MazE/SpoVT family DNA-binding domain-containing protein [Mycobacterium sp.]
METIPVSNAPTSVRSPAIATASGNTLVCLVRFALANIRRRPERFVLSVLGIALAIACVTVVRTISASFAITGDDSVTDVLSGAQLWAVPAAGVHYDADAQALVADGAAPTITVPAGWTATRVLSGVTDINGSEVSVRGRDEISSGQASLGAEVARRLNLHPGDRVEIGGQSLVVTVAGTGQSITMATPLARSIVGDNGWWTIYAPTGDEKRRDLGQTLGAAVGLQSTSDPSV